MRRPQLPEARLAAGRPVAYDFATVPIYDGCHAPAGPSGPVGLLPLQAKLEVGSVDDPLERGADRVAWEITRDGSAAPARCACGGVVDGSGGCAQCAQKRLSRMPAGPATPVPQAVPASVHRALSGAGRPLDASTRAFFEPRLSADLGAVRIHDDATAASSARDVAARAYTVGREVVFGAGQFAPRTPEGRLLIAHELAHVVQQTGAAEAPRLQRKPASGSLAEAADPIEEEEFPDYAWQLLITTGGWREAPGPAVIRAVAAENGDVDLKGIAGPPPFTYRNFVRGGTIRPSYFSFRHPTRGIVLRAFAELDGYHPRRRPSPKELRSEAHEYSFYFFAPRAGSTRARYSFPMPLSSAAPAPAEEQRKGQPAPERVMPSAQPWNSLPNMLVRWKYAGLLDPPALPQGVRPIPPLPVTEQQAKQLKADLSVPVAGYLLGATATPAGTTGTALAGEVAVTGGDVLLAEGTGAWTAAAGTGSWSTAEVVGEAVGTAAEETAGVELGAAGGVSAGALAAGVTAGAVVLFYPSSLAPGWMDEISQITGTAYSGPGEFGWEGKLDGPQTDYIKELWKGRSTDVAPRPRTQTEPDTEERRDRRRRRRCSPTGLSPDDPIPLVWYKPLSLYPETIEIQGHSYRRDVPTRLPHGEPIGVSRQWWPPNREPFQLLPERRGQAAREFREILRDDYHFDWGGLQADHVRDLQWSGPDSFRNLWPFDMRQNPSAGTRQNNSQVVGVCIGNRGPYVTRSISDLKRAGGFYGRWFTIERMEY
jgi:hypothetical protein